MNYLLALDQGTSSTRAMLYTTDGRLAASSQRSLTQYYPQVGWVEHDPEEIWQSALTVLREVLLHVPAHSILACGITNQRETTVIWNKKTGKCLAPAIVWQDRRTADYCLALSEYTSMIQQRTGLLLDSYFSASKLNWLLHHNAAAKESALRGELAFGTIDSFLIWRLTKGNHVTDVTNASRTMLFNIQQEQWDNELLSLFDIPKLVLPKVLASDGQFGVIDKEYLNAEIPITGVAGDQQAALIGQGCLHEGMVKATYGTGGFLLLHTGDKPMVSQHKLLTTIAYKIKECTAYGLEGSIYHAGTTIKWLRDEMNLISTAAETERLAQSITSNDGVYLISAFTGLGAPHWCSTLGASICGISRSTTRAHFARAALEGVCYQTYDILKCMREDSGLDLSLLRVDGGMAVNTWLLQFLADQCQLAVQKPQDIETTARGAAVLAGIGHGVYNSFSALDSMWQMDKEFIPTRSLDEVERNYSGWIRALDTLRI